MRREPVVWFGGVGAAAVLFLVLAGLVWHTRGPVYLDEVGHRVTAATGVGGIVAGGHLRVLRSSRLAVAAVNLGQPAAVAALAGLVLYLAVACRDWVGGVVAVAGPALTGVVTEHVAKPLIHRQAPSGAYLFPSGHAGGVAAVCVAALVIVYRHGGGRAVAAALPVATAPVVIVGAGLVRLGDHWSTDVAGGAALASAVVLALAGALAVASPRRPPPDRAQGVA